MAERRMFAKKIVNSARFLQLPVAAQLLYFHLGMQADDDGAVEAFTVMRITGATEDDLQVLVDKGFITILNDELVSYITDWKQNNQIRKDRYTASMYTDLLNGLTFGQPSVNQRLPQYSTGKESEEIYKGIKVEREEGEKGIQGDTRDVLRRSTPAPASSESDSSSPSLNDSEQRIYIAAIQQGYTPEGAARLITEARNKRQVKTIDVRL